ncbi:ATP-binding protein [Ramlibacter sp. 2FC]|uniref:sensor histidine kinase n=1 Tax=Ramlibacter sp. 2FC TaxID=2502188 RepID=UPI0010F88F08|nr:ATP-binding protein [Ramlibacter sp. 2FC]
MRQAWQRTGWWVLAWCVITAAGALVFARQELLRLREGFETDARIAHRLLSQRVVQHEAVLATLALLQPAGTAEGGTPPEQRLPSLYPQILAVQRRDRGADWPDARLRAAEAPSQAQRGAALAAVDFELGRYQLLLAAEPASFALSIDLRTMVPWSEWPMAADTSPVRLTLEHQGQRFVLQPGRPAPAAGWHFEARKALAAQSQPFELVATRQVGWAELPWGRMAGWALAVLAALAALRQWQRQRVARRRAEELLRLGQVARLNTLGELAAGMAHELNQPLTAVLANTQAARRLLAEDPPELDTARQAMGQAEAQAKRASDVVGRLRRVVERPGLGDQAQTVNLAEAVRRALHLLEPECRRRGVTPELDAPAALPVRAEPVALDQIIHNLLMNALQALEQVPPAERRLALGLQQHGQQGELTVADSGPGIPAELLPRIFEPFFSTREGGLGLGLSLSETLATNLGGALTAQANPPRGALFRLSLPLQATPA